jgi:hypothetical protein
MLIFPSLWPRGFRRGYMAIHLLGLWVRIPQVAWMSFETVVCCQVEVYETGWSLIQRGPNECGVSEWDREALIMRRTWPAGGLMHHEKKSIKSPIFIFNNSVFFPHAVMCCVRFSIQNLYLLRYYLTALCNGELYLLCFRNRIFK